jgi:hypothetical protein
MVSINVDLSALERWADDFREVADEIPAAVSRAINRAGDMAVTQVGRTLAEETGLGVRDVRSGISTERATAAEPVYEITVHSRQTTLGEFDPRPTRQGVSTRPWAVRRVFPHTFGIRDEVFRRVGPERYPITPLFGPNVAQLAHEGATTDVIRETVAEVFPQRLRHEMERVVGRKLPYGLGDDEGDEAAE